MQKGFRVKEKSFRNILKYLILSVLFLPTFSYGQPFNTYVTGLYETSSLRGQISYTLFYESMLGYHNLKFDNGLNDSLLVIVDFRQSCREKRFYVYHIFDRRLVFRTLVAHGKNSGGKYAVNFSNDVGSLASSTGFYTTGECYMGSNGLSLRVHGLDKGLNDKVLERKVVIHSADYVRADSVGKSEGCLALPRGINEEIINLIKGGVCIYVKGFATEPKSKFLSEEKIKEEFETFRVSEMVTEFFEE